ncbi:hypothetical protein [Streptomyces sp900116325]|uniref:hypothetical protein n=1 Tax=Streptomyces sp. 900116325 TaxID=3154295 RepID=UPI0033A68938
MEARLGSYVQVSGTTIRWDRGRATELHEGVGMNAETVTATCAVVIAVASLAVSVYQTHAMRQHNRHSVRPVLQLHRGWPPGGRAGIRLINSGLGPAVIVDSTLTVDGEVIGIWNEGSVNSLRRGLAVHPSAVTFNEGEVIATDYEQYLFSVASYDLQSHAEIEDLINRRLTLKIRYESLYGGENFQVVLAPKPLNGSLRAADD